MCVAWVSVIVASGPVATDAPLMKSVRFVPSALTTTCVNAPCAIGDDVTDATVALESHRVKKTRCVPSIARYHPKKGADVRWETMRLFGSPPSVAGGAPGETHTSIANGGEPPKSK